MKTYQNLIFDLDDTIIRCGHYYAKAKTEFVQFSYERTGLPPAMIETLLNDIDLSCTALPNGFNRERYPRSFRAASNVLDIIRGVPVDATAGDKSFEIGDSVFSAPYEMFDGARDVLTKYKSTGHRLFMCTKGDDEVQQRKIDIHSLTDLFESPRIYIVGKKTPETVQKILSDHQLIKESTVFIGDSLRDDVGSAIKAGIDSVWINKPDRHVWAYENNQDHRPTHILERITELPSIIPI